MQSRFELQICLFRLRTSLYAIENLHLADKKRDCSESKSCFVLDNTPGILIHMIDKYMAWSQVGRVNGIKCSLPRLHIIVQEARSQKILSGGWNAFIVPDEVTQRLVGESLMLAVAQLVQVGDAGEVDHRRWTAHQHLTIGSNKKAKGCPEYFVTEMINKCVLAIIWTYKVVFGRGKKRFLDHLCVDEAWTVLPIISRPVDLDFKRTELPSHTCNAAVFIKSYIYVTRPLALTLPNNLVSLDWNKDPGK